MEHEIKEAAYIGIQLLVSAAIIAIIAMTLLIGRGFYSIQESEKQSKNLLSEQVEFYNYMSNQGNITGSDIVDIMATYSRVYDFVVISKSTGTAQVVLSRTGENKLDDWSIQNLKADLGDEIHSKYTMQQVLTVDGHAIYGIVFTSNSDTGCSASELNKIKTDIFKISSESSYK